MDKNVEQALEFTIKNWEYMLSQDQESLSDEFMSSFYDFIKAIREWTDGLEKRPSSLADMLQLPMIKEILNRLPSELHLNVKTEIGLIIERQRRTDS